MGMGSYGVGWQGLLAKASATGAGDGDDPTNSTGVTGPFQHALALEACAFLGLLGLSLGRLAFLDAPGHKNPGPSWNLFSIP